MADVKISGLPASTTPLAGTEVLPVVQSGVTKKVASDDLTVKNIRSNATTGILQVTGPAAAATRVMTAPDANFSVARIDAAQSFTGDQTLSTGNLVIGTSGKGIDFSATAGTGTSELLADYEEGTFTPTTTTSGYTLNVANGYYTKVGQVVHIYAAVAFSAVNILSTSSVTINGLPFTSTSLLTIPGVCSDSTTTAAIYMAYVPSNSSRIELNSMDGVSTGSQRIFNINEQYVVQLTYRV
jgi:hypothetical protein